MRALQQALEELSLVRDNSEQLYQCVVDFLVAHTGAGVVSIGPCGTSGQDENVFRVTDLGYSWAPDILKTLHQGGARAISRNQAAVAQLGGQDRFLLIAVPLTGPQQGQALCVAIDTVEQAFEPFMVILELVRQCLALAIRDVSPAGAADFSAELRDAVAAPLESGDRKKAGPFFVQKIKEYFQADVVMLAPRPKGVGGQFILHSSVSGLNESAPQMKLVKQVIDECQQEEKMLTCNSPLIPTGSMHSFLLRDMSAAFFVDSSVCFPLISHDGTVQGGMIVCWKKAGESVSKRMEAFTQAAPLIGSFVSWLTQPAYGGQLRKSLLNARQRTGILAGLVCGTILLGMLPVPFSVTGTCVLEPRQTRFVVAQFDGVLKRVYIQPGTKVQKGELLAEFDERVIELEINALQADMTKTKKLQDVQTAAGKAALAQMAGLERQGLEEKLKLYQQRLAQLSVHSPVEGIVISENMERAEGSPISRGQGLFEIAPLDIMMAEAHIAQEDISYVQTKAPTEIRLESFPGKTLKSSVYSIFPRSELRGGRNVFLVESLLENPDALYKPGMQGEVSVIVGKKPLFWKLFRRPWMAFQKTFLND